MDDLNIKSTFSTPQVYLYSQQRKLVIRGICTPENPKLFFEPILEGVLKLRATSDMMLIVVNLSYYNSGSAKALLNLFLEASKGVTVPGRVQIRWVSDDEELRESGKMFEELLSVNFEYTDTED
jgi:hypothetical protein